MMKNSTPLSEKLKSYSLLAGGLLASAAAADAQVIYTDINRDIYVDWSTPDTMHLDLNHDGIVDFVFSGSITWPWLAFSVSMEALSGNAVSFTNDNVGVIHQGDTIDDNLDWHTGNRLLLAYAYYSSSSAKWSQSGNWLGITGFLALRFTINGETHYGWARLKVASSGHWWDWWAFSVYDCAYEATANKPIKAGDTGCELFYPDSDNDGYGGVNSQGDYLCNIPATGYSALNSDCDDFNETTHPSAYEDCNGIDDDCNGQSDEGWDLTTYYADKDSDGYGNAKNSEQACVAPPNYVSDSTDCDDNNPNVNPGRTEILNGIDDNCNGLIDEGLTGIDEATASSFFSIFPNPNNGSVTIQTTLRHEESLSIKAFDVVGKLVYAEVEGKVVKSFSKQLDLSHLSAGTYFIQFIHDGKREVKKFIIEK